MQALIELVRTRVDYLVQESVKVIKDILRRYPNRYESIIKDFCDNLKALNFADERAAMIWIVGEYADKNITNSVPLIESFAENFKEEAPVVQQAILTAAVKIYLKLESEAEEMIVDILKLATEEAENPDLRNRGYIYWRMLTADPELAKKLILEEKPIISDHSESIDPTVLDELIAHLGTLASISGRPPQKTILDAARIKERFDLETADEVEEVEEIEDSTGVKRSEYKGEADVDTYMPDLLGLDDADATGATAEEAKSSPSGGLDLLDEVLGLSSPNESKNKKSSDQGIDLLGDEGLHFGKSVSEYVRVPEKLVLSETDVSTDTDESGLDIKASFQRINEKLILELNIHNTTNKAVDDFAIKFNKNSFGLEPADQIPYIKLSPNDFKKVTIEISVNENNNNKSPGMPILIDCALKTSLGVFLFEIPVMLSVLIIKSSTMVNGKELREQWNSIELEDSMFYTVKSLSMSLTSPQKIKERLLDHNIIFIEEGRNNDGAPCLYFTAKTTSNHVLIIQLTFKEGDCTLCIKSKVPTLVPLAQQAINFILGAD